MALTDLFSVSKRLLQQQRDIDKLRSEVFKLRAQNDSMRQGMRRCVTCEYRIECKARQDSDTDVQQAPVPHDPDNKQ